MSTTTPETTTYTFTIGQRVRLRDGMTAQVGSPGTPSSLPAHIRTGVVRETPDHAGDLRIQWDGEADRGPRWCHQSVLEPETPTPVVFAPGLRVRVKEGQNIRLASGTDTTPPGEHATVRTGTVQGVPDDVSDVRVRWDGMAYDLWCHTEVLEPEGAPQQATEPVAPAVRTARVVRPTSQFFSCIVGAGTVLTYFPEMPNWSLRDQSYGDDPVYVLMLVEDAPTSSYATAVERNSNVPEQFADKPSVWVLRSEAEQMHAVFDDPDSIVPFDSGTLDRWAPFLGRKQDQHIYRAGTASDGRTIVVSREPFFGSARLTTSARQAHNLHGALVGWHYDLVHAERLGLMDGTLTDPARRAAVLQEVTDEIEEATEEFRDRVKEAAVDRARSNGVSQFMPKVREMLEELGIDVSDIPDEYNQRVTATIMVPIEIEVVVPHGTDPGSYEIRDYITVTDHGDSVSIEIDHTYLADDEDSEPEISSGTPDVTDYNVEDDE